MCARAERMKELENDIILFFALLITNTGIFSVSRISGIDVVLLSEDELMQVETR